MHSNGIAPKQPRVQWQGPETVERMDVPTLKGQSESGMAREPNLNILAAEELPKRMMMSAKAMPMEYPTKKSDPARSEERKRLTEVMSRRQNRSIPRPRRVSAARVQTDVSTRLGETPKVKGKSDANPKVKG